MKTFATWSGAAALLSSLLLAACGGNSSSSDTAQVRLINATQTHTSLALLANSSSAITATALDTISAYASVSSGSPALQLNDATTSTVLATTAPSLAAGQHYTLVAYESGGVIRTAILAEDTAAPASGTVNLRVFDAASDAGAIDIYVTDPTTDLTTVTSPNLTFGASTVTQANSYVAIAPGTYRIRVTGQGNTSDLRLDIPSVVLTSQQLATVILTPTSGGTLANGGVLQQQGAFTATRNSNARVRLVADVGGGGVVSASAGTTPISTNVTSPAVGAYQIVPASSTLSLSVNGVPLAAPTSLLTAGSDVTLVAYGNSAATARSSLIVDDNHLPTSTSALKIRLFNGLTGATSPLALTADFSQVANNVLPGTASPYSTIAASTSVRVEVTSNAGSIYLESGLNVPGNAVYTLFLLGDSSAPVHQLRRDH